MGKLTTKKLNSKGFTLIELLIVIIIIGILAAIAFVAYGSATSKAHKSDAQATIAQAKEKLASYNADNNSYPATIGDFDNWLNSDLGSNNKALSLKFVSPDYTYAVSPSGCGDTVTVTSGTGTVTPGTTACTGFTLNADGSKLGFSGTLPDVTN